MPVFAGLDSERVLVVLWSQLLGITCESFAYMIYLPLPNMKLHDHEIQLKMEMKTKKNIWLGRGAPVFVLIIGVFKPTFFNLCIFLVKLFSQILCIHLFRKIVFWIKLTKYFYSVTKICKISQSAIISYSTSSICLNSNDI